MALARRGVRDLGDRRLGLPVRIADEVHADRVEADTEVARVGEYEHRSVGLAAQLIRDQGPGNLRGWSLAAAEQVAPP